LFKAKKRKTKNQKLIQLSDLFLEKKSKVNDQRQDFLKKPPQSLEPTFQNPQHLLPFT
jgi:hypothetical protein